MRKNFVLIDHENVQPVDFSGLHKPHIHVRLFLGPSQARIPVELACALQPLGSNAEYVRLETAGRNALDFCMAYHLGVLSREEPEGYFHIVSKDTGFDSLIRHMRVRKILVARCSSLDQLPWLKPLQQPAVAPAQPLPTEPAPAPPAKKSPPAANGHGLEADVILAITHLKGMKNARPRKLKTLQSTLHTLFKTRQPEPDIEKIITALRGAGRVQCSPGEVISYKF